MALDAATEAVGLSQEHLEGARRLAAGMLECAVRDAQGRQAGDPEAALAFLRSPRAYLWFDLLDLDPEAFNERLQRLL